MKNKADTLEDAIKEIMRHARIIDDLQKTIKEQYGIKMNVQHIGMFDATANIAMRNGIEEVCKIFGKEPKMDGLINWRKVFRHYGFEIWQSADDKVKHFTKAGEEKPKVEFD